MNKSNTTLIIGGTSMIGIYLRSKNPGVLYTSREKTADIYFDFEDLVSYKNVDSAIIKHGVSQVIVLAALTSIQKCNDFTDRAYNINVTRTKLLLDRLDNLNCFYIFVSSNHIFDCNKSHITYNYPYSPCSIYGQHKAIIEQHILENTHQAAILRPTKIISQSFTLIKNMQQHLINNMYFDAFSDHYFSPITVSFFEQMVSILVSNRSSGIYQISGESDISYYNFLVKVADSLDLNSNLITPKKAISKGVIANNFGSLTPYGFEPQSKSQESISEVINFIKKVYS